MRGWLNALENLVKVPRVEPRLPLMRPYKLRQVGNEVDHVVDGGVVPKERRLSFQDERNTEGDRHGAGQVADVGTRRSGRLR